MKTSQNSPASNPEPKPAAAANDKAQIALAGALLPEATELFRKSSMGETICTTTGKMALYADALKVVSDHLAAIARAGDAKGDLGQFWLAQSAWSQATFGTDAERGPIGALKHLAKEAAEAQKDPTDLMEFVDCLFLTFDSTRRAGFTFTQLVDAAWKKLEINKARTWSKPTKGDEPVEHDRSGEVRTPPAKTFGASPAPAYRSDDVTVGELMRWLNHECVNAARAEDRGRQEAIARLAEHVEAALKCFRADNRNAATNELNAVRDAGGAETKAIELLDQIAYLWSLVGPDVRDKCGCDMYQLIHDAGLLVAGHKAVKQSGATKETT